jgi:tetratricopeptide (TPR) repeat protein
MYFLLGAAVHQQRQLDQALEYYFIAERLDPEYYPTKSNIGAALQSLGELCCVLY